MINTKVCPSCQKENPEDSRVCVHCGVSLVAKSPSNTTIPVSESASRISHPDHIIQLVRLYADIIVFQVLGNEQPILIKDATKITIGRFSAGETAPTIDLGPYNGNLLGVSRQHAVINRHDKGYSLVDLGSTNGTWLNEIKLTAHQPYDLRNGDLIRIGQMAMYAYFRMGEAAPPPEETIKLKNRDAVSAFTLTSHNLETVIVPYLNSISGIQFICNQLAEQRADEVVITGLSFDTEKGIVEVKMTGAKQAIKIVKEKIVLKQEVPTVEIAGAIAQNGTPSSAESNGSVGQTAVNTNDPETAMALQILAEVAPNRSEDERKTYLDKLLPHLRTLSSSTLQFDLYS